MKVLRQYKTHHYIDTYEKVDIFCPQCGLKSVWEEQSEGDYYVGPDYFCTSCEHTFTIQGPAKASEPHNILILEQLRTGETLEPTTKSK